MLAAREAYNQLFEAQKPNKVIEMINSIGEVTLEDQELIEEIEELYNSLTDEQKAKVTNYETLVAARAKLNELIAAAPKETRVTSCCEASSSIKCSIPLACIPVAVIHKSPAKNKPFIFISVSFIHSLNIHSSELRQSCTFSEALSLI